MSREQSERGPRPYPHGTGDRNVMDSADSDDAPVHDGGRQKKPASAPLEQTPPRGRR